MHIFLSLSLEELLVPPDIFKAIKLFKSYLKAFLTSKNIIAPKQFKYSADWGHNIFVCTSR